MRQELTHGRAVAAVRIRTRVEEQSPFLRATQHLRGHQELRGRVDLKRGVGPHRQVAFDVPQPVRVLPHDVVGRDNRGREARDAGLLAQRVEKVAEPGEDQVVGGVHEHGCRQ